MPSPRSRLSRDRERQLKSERTDLQENFNKPVFHNVMGFNEQLVHPSARFQSRPRTGTVPFTRINVPQPLRRRPQTDLRLDQVVEFPLNAVLTVVRHLAKIAVKDVGALQFGDAVAAFPPKIAQNQNRFAGYVEAESNRRISEDQTRKLH